MLLVRLKQRHCRLTPNLNPNLTNAVNPNLNHILSTFAQTRVRIEDTVNDAKF